MKVELLQVLSTYIFQMKPTTIVLFFLFVIMVLGYLLGKVSIKGVSLGSAAIFLVALVVGHFKGVAFENYTSWAADEASVDAYFSMVKNIGLVLFVTAVGLIAGPGFFHNLVKNAKSYVLLGLIIICSGAAACAVITLATGISSDITVGLLAGALTSTPALSAAQEAAGAGNNVAVGYAIAYPFGVVGVVAFVQIIPKMLKANMAEERTKLIVVEEEKASDKEKKMFRMDKDGIGAFALAIAFGIIIGSIHIPLGGGASFSLGTTGGPLLAGLIIGHFRHIGPVDLRSEKAILGFMQELGLILFLIGSGIEGGAGFVATLQKEGAILFLWGAVLTLVPMLLGFFFAKYVLKMSLLNNLGSMCGGMTSTPALGTLIKVAETSDVASAYAATYPIALVAIVLASQFLTYL
jgi:putative transport protein